MISNQTLILKFLEYAGALTFAPMKEGGKPCWQYCHGKLRKGRIKALVYNFLIEKKEPVTPGRVRKLTKMIKWHLYETIYEGSDDD